MTPPLAIAIRQRAAADASHLVAAGLTPVLARIYAARGVQSIADMQTALAGLPPPDLLLHAGRAAVRLADAIERHERILIVADYDADGATACAVGVRGLRAYGADVDFIVPNRFEYGYGLTPEIVTLAAPRQPRLLITVDNGIASVEGVAEANRRGIEVLVTDHHLPGDELPAAFCIVNPNQVGCPFPSKHIAGVGVMFYVLLALRAELRRREHPEGAGFKLASLLDLVALGTVADVVRLDATNRILVAQGLARMRGGALQSVTFMAAFVVVMLASLGFILMTKDRADADNRYFAAQDALTGLANRRALNAARNRDVSRGVRLP